MTQFPPKVHNALQDLVDAGGTHNAFVAYYSSAQNINQLWANGILKKDQKTQLFDQLAREIEQKTEKFKQKASL
jgi:hypothetical protein